MCFTLFGVFKGVGFLVALDLVDWISSDGLDL